MVRIKLLAVTFVLISSSVNAEIEKLATPTDAGMQFQWWPKVQAPPGWHFDSGSSHYFAFNAIAPDGSTFSKAETVMYAKADFKPRIPESKSLTQLIEQDIAEFKKSDPGMVVTIESPVLTADRRKFKVVMFAPSSGGNWERVAYGEADDFYVMFTVSSRSKEGLESAMEAFKIMVGSYRVGPNRRITHGRLG